jgi:hypothetical protein
MSQTSCVVFLLAALIFWQSRELDTVLRHQDPQRGH